MTNNKRSATDAPNSVKGGRLSSRGTAPLVAVLAVVIITIAAGWILVLTGWVSTASDYVTLVARGGFTGLGALAVAALLHYRWTIDRDDQIEQENTRFERQQKLERERLNHQSELERERLERQDSLERERVSAERQRHREQERGKRQEKMGDRMAQAISHLGEGRGFMQVSGLIELAGLVDDWWSLGQEMLADIPDENNAERENVREMIQLRRQELIDLMYKHTLSPDAAVFDGPGGQETDAEKQRRRMVQEGRVQSLVSHLPDPADESSWVKLDLSKAYLEGDGVDLARVKLSGAMLKGAYLGKAGLQYAHLEGADLFGAHLEGASMIWARLEGAKLFGAHLEGANLIGAHLEGANLDFASLTGAKLHGVHLEGVDLTITSLDDHYDGSPIYDAKTRFPAGYDPDRAGFKLKHDDREDPTHPDAP